QLPHVCHYDGHSTVSISNGRMAERQRIPRSKSPPRPNPAPRGKPSPTTPRTTRDVEQPRPHAEGRVEGLNNRIVKSSLYCCRELLFMQLFMHCEWKDVLKCFPMFSISDKPV